MNAILREIASCRLQSVSGGLTFTRDSGGTTITAKPSGGGSGGNITLKLQAIDATEGNTAKATVTFGQGNGTTTPTISTVALDDPATPKLTLTVSGVIYLKITMADATTPTNLSTIEILNAASLPSPNTTTICYCTLATVTITGTAGTDQKITALANALAGSLSVFRCGGINYSFGSY